MFRKRQQVNYTEELKKKLKEFMEFMRELFKGIDNSIYNSLNEEYEEELMVLIGMVPNDWCYGLNDSLGLIWDCLECLNIHKLADAVESHPKARFWFQINSYQMFYHNCVEKFDNITEQEKKATKKILDKLIPFFTAVDKVMRDPIMLIRRAALIADRQNNENGDILGELA